MSDHADTVRDALMLYSQAPHPDALAALDALVAERDEARLLSEDNFLYLQEAYARAEAAEADRDRWEQTCKEVFSHLVAITPHKQRCEEPDDPGCPGCVVNSEFERLAADEFVARAALKDKTP